MCVKYIYIDVYICIYITYVCEIKNIDYYNGTQIKEHIVTSTPEEPFLLFLFSVHGE